MNTMFKLEDFLPYYPAIDGIDPIYNDTFGNIINKKSEFASLIPKKPTETQEGYFTNQEFIGKFLSPSTPYKRLLVFHGIGSGKCHAYDTPVLMYDGSIKMIQDIVIGDNVMGDDSTPRFVSSLVRGNDNLYTVKQTWGSKYTINSDHILCLKSTSLIDEIKPFLRTEELHWNIYEIPVNIFISLPENIKTKLKGYISKVEFLEDYTDIENIGDIAAKFCKVLQSTTEREYKSQSDIECMLNKIVTNSVKIRQRFLDTIIELIGYNSQYTGLSYIILENKNIKSEDKKIIKKLVFLIRSLGYYSKWDHIRQFIIIDTKREYTDITVKWDRRDTYYGFTCDKNHRYLLGDCTVTHNSCLIAAVTEIAKHTRNVDMIPSSGFTTLILVKGNDLKEELYSQIINVCPTKEQYQRDTAEESKKLIKSIYRIETYNDFNKELREKLSNIKTSVDVLESLQEEFKNKYIIIDEVHNLYPEPKTVPERYDNILKLFTLLQDTKIALLTATPMKNSVKEIAYLMNLVVPINKRVVPKNFELIINKQDNNLLNQLKHNYFLGYVSYYRTLTSVRIQNIGKVSPENGIYFTNIVQVNMGKIQNSSYKDNLEQEAPEFKNLSDADIYEYDKKTGLYPKSCQSSCAIFPDGKIDDPQQKWITYNNTIPEVTEVFEKWLRRGYVAGGKDIEHKVALQNIELISSKFYYIIKTILNSHLQKHYVYGRYIKNVGLEFLCALLKFFGFQEFEYPNNIQDIPTIGLTLEEKQKAFEQKYGITKAPRFIIISGTSNLKVTESLKIFNNDANMYGEYISVIMGGIKVQEGLSFSAIRNIFIANPEWNNATLDQAIGRGIRSKSHDILPPEERVVNIHKIWSKPLDVKPTIDIDIHRYKISEDKNIKIKRVERIIKEASVDCEINKSRNIQITDEPYSVECDYLEHCNYNCVFNTTPQLEINDTYNLYYSERSEKDILQAIVYAYTLKSSYFFDELYTILQSVLKTHINNIVLAKTLYYIISNNIAVYNKYGFINYLREEANVYFLVDDPKAGTQYDLCYYAKNPYPTSTLSEISQSVEEYLYTKTHKYITWFFEAQDPFMYINLGGDTFKQVFYNMFNGALSDPKTNQKMKQFFKQHRDLEKEYLDTIEQDTPEPISTKATPEEITNYSYIWGFRGKLETKDGKIKIKIRDTSIIGFKKSDNELNSSTIRDGIVCGTGEFNFRGLCKLVLQLFMTSVILYQNLPMLEYIMDNFIQISNSSKEIIYNVLQPLGGLDLLKKEILVHNMKNVSLVALKGIASTLSDKNDIEPERNSTIRNIIRYTEKENRSIISTLRVLRVYQLELINSHLKIIDLNAEINKWFNSLSPEQENYLKYIPSIIDTERIKGQKEMSGGLCDEIKDWLIDMNLVL